MKNIKLTKNKIAIVDDHIYSDLNKYKWYFHSGGYAVRTIPNSNSQKVLMHRQILNAPDDEEVDHVNGNRLDNRTENLRLSSRKQNAQNSSAFSDKMYSKYKGVTWFKRDNKWKSQLKTEGTNIHLGYFDNECDAAQAYNFAAIKHFGEFARLNT